MVGTVSRPNVGVAAELGELVELDVAVCVERQAVSIQVSPRARVGCGERADRVDLVGDRDGWPATYRAELALIAVRPLPNTSIAKPTRGEMSFQFWTMPAQRSPGSTVPSSQSPNVAPAPCRLGSTELSRDSPMNWSKRRPRFSVMRPIDQRSWSVDAEVAIDAVVAIRRQAQGGRERGAVVVGDRLHVAGPHREQLPVAVAQRAAGTEAVRASHVRRRAHEGAQHREVIRRIGHAFACRLFDGSTTL